VDPKTSQPTDQPIVQWIGVTRVTARILNNGLILATSRKAERSMDQALGEWLAKDVAFREGVA